MLRYLRCPVDIVIRPAADDDEADVLALLGASLGWGDADEFRSFFRWKHLDNPFGRSYAWVGVDPATGTVVGYRALLRWRFVVDGHPVPAVRAVDTATHPDWQGRGIFSALTQHGLRDAAADGVGFVFNTPNDKSRPGYLKMGWEVVGRVPIRVRPRSPLALARMVRSRTAADRWGADASDGAPHGEGPLDVFADDRAVRELLSAQPATGGVRTDVDPAHLRWRFGGFPPNGYRALTVGSDVRCGAVAYRLRRRGAGTEAVIGALLAPGGDRRVARRLVGAVMRATRADYALASGGGVLGGMVPLPRQGPVLTWRGLDGSAMPPLARWHLAMGDIEQF